MSECLLERAVCRTGLLAARLRQAASPVAVIAQAFVYCAGGSRACRASDAKRVVAAPPIARDLIQIYASRAHGPAGAGLSRTCHAAFIGAFTCCICRRTHAAAFAERRCRMQPNGKLVFNIRISTEAEINGTVKGDV
ncbi:hypothetical protein [Bradyrhizobium sp. NAS80.1]|uniref:hypothetical protein n=1 Tax=Bradyrhizobium sp. NAS80.1 TaxID=1680159 RepID=UPI001160F729|nr:hypothetical protein [Bradyrhizobium sp. NAS80.1]